MAFRLLVKNQGIETSFALHRGENLVGCEGACDITITHATISRHHACLLLVPKQGKAQGGEGPDGELSIVDLGSKNGTWVGHERIQNSRPLETPAEVRFGSISGVVEWIARGDSRPAPAFPLLRELPAPPAPPIPAAATTASVGPLYLFTLSYLPDLLKAANRGEGAHVVASRLGVGLREALPCVAYRIESRSAAAGPELSTLSQWREESRDDVEEIPWRRGEAGGFQVSMRFAAVEHERVFVPILELSASLLGLAEKASRRVRGCSEIPWARGTRPKTKPPDPPTLDASLIRLYERAEKVAGGDVHVLIRGGSGTGKELLASYIHNNSARSDGPFVALNCAALSRDLQEVELFGIEKGMATGVEAQSGRFEQAHGGTLFLDEIGDMAPEVQAKILRVLQEKEVFRIGGRKAKPADVRVLSATHQDLEDMLESGDFRSDLYHRIADWECRLPSLRERKVDIPNLAAFFLAESVALQDRPPMVISESALEALVRYVWPGNIRQLEREIKKACLFVPEGGLLTTEHLSVTIVEALDAEESDGGPSLRSAMEKAEKDHIRRTLHALEGDVPAASDALQVPASTLYRKIKKHGL